MTQHPDIMIGTGEYSVLIRPVWVHRCEGLVPRFHVRVLHRDDDGEMIEDHWLHGIKAVELVEVIVTRLDWPRQYAFGYVNTLSTLVEQYHHATT